jgi:hypothetical protein
MARKVSNVQYQIGQGRVGGEHVVQRQLTKD